MNAKTLEQKINEKIGRGNAYEIDENVSLIRTFEHDEIVVMDSESSMNGHHLLKFSSQEEIDRIARHFKFTDPDDDLIPD